MRRQLELVGQGLVAAQTRAHHQQGVNALVKSLAGFLQVVRTQTGGVVFGQHAAPLHRGDHTPSHRHQALHSRPGTTGTATEPQQWPFFRCQQIGQGLHSTGLRHQRGDRPWHQIKGQRQAHGLHIDGDFNADGATGRRESHTHGFAQSGQRSLGIANSKSLFAHRLEHGQLRRMLMDKAQITIKELRLDLASQVQQRRACRDGLHHGPRRVAATGSGTGHAHAQHATHAGCGIGHVAGASFPTCRDKTDLPTGVESIEDGHVVDGNHAIGGFHAARFKETGDQFAHGDAVRRRVHSIFFSLDLAGHAPRWGKWLRRSVNCAAAAFTISTSGINASSSMR